MNCQYCGSKCNRAGKQSNGKQKYQCGDCKKYQQKSYSYEACSQETKIRFKRQVKRANGISELSFILKISEPTVISWIRKYGRSTKPCHHFKQGDIYELDELKTHVGKKRRERWVICAKSRTTGRIIEMKVGRRTKVHLKVVVDKLLALNPKRIYTDGLKVYKSLIPKEIHCVTRFGINHLERFHLTLRTHIKRLNRKTICYSRKQDMLENTIRIYLWGEVL